MESERHFMSLIFFCLKLQLAAAPALIAGTGDGFRLTEFSI